ncbi:sensor histidine kinase [Cryobacterium sp. PH31-O1]|uniref:sensor histidine kinase n=1 Tax=Cryobacterium sp. PH31-O1 TaxID=3046306 RepID=UPI0024BAA6C0|nr:sensor histidine kinase [Cryobacterium sp. PH31-O1]MDJ0339738.1 sensor histidine kinase [Cryobacterium sp. PH31-O1]
MSNLGEPFAENWRRPRPSPREARIDLWIALGLAAGTALSVSLGRSAGAFADSPVWLVLVWVPLISLPLIWRRRWPEVIALLVAMTFAGGAILGVGDVLFSNIALYIAIFSVGASSRNRTFATWTRIAIVVGMFTWLISQLFMQANQATTLPELSRDGLFSAYAAFGLLQVLINLLYFGAAWYFGDSAWRSARNTAALEASTLALIAEREHSARQAISLERVRIARELHDVVAHHVSLMGVQAGAARRIMNQSPAKAAEALGVIEQSARTAVDELHTMLGSLRSGDSDSSAGSANPTADDAANASTSTRGIDQLDELVDESSAAGVPVTMSIVGVPRPVPATIGLSIYRIAQEALTNTRKHAGAGARGDLRLRYEADAVELEVTDNGIGPRRLLSGVASHSGTAPATGCGLGQRGMQERVTAVGGDLHVGARPRGGYLVRARFPLAAPAHTGAPDAQDAPA